MSSCFARKAIFLIRIGCQSCSDQDMLSPVVDNYSNTNVTYPILVTWCFYRSTQYGLQITHSLIDKSFELIWCSCRFLLLQTTRSTLKRLKKKSHCDDLRIVHFESMRSERKRLFTSVKIYYLNCSQTAYGYFWYTSYLSGPNTCLKTTTCRTWVTCRPVAWSTSMYRYWLCGASTVW